MNVRVPGKKGTSYQKKANQALTGQAKAHKCQSDDTATQGFLHEKRKRNQKKKRSNFE